ncbi:PIN domain-containing protein [Deferrisoma sp.]
MILVDTSVWVDHFRTGLPSLQVLLEKGEVLIHPYVIGELGCGHLRQRRKILQLLGDLPAIPVVPLDVVLEFVETQGLMGKGLGFVDVSLLAAVREFGGSSIWTLDRRLNAAAKRLGVAWNP